MDVMEAGELLIKPERGDLGDDAGDDDGSEGADGKILENDFQGEEDAAEGGIEDGADAGGAAAAGEQRHVAAGEAEEFADAGGDGGADLDDRPLGAGRSAGADGDAAGEDFFDGDERALEPAGADDGFHDIDDTVSLGPAQDVGADESHGQSAGGGENDEQNQSAAIENVGRHVGIEGVADEDDQLMKADGGDGGGDADEDGENEEEGFVAEAEAIEEASDQNAQANGGGGETQGHRRGGYSEILNYEYEL
jgi:hypothetical protein